MGSCGTSPACGFVFWDMPRFVIAPCPIEVKDHQARDEGGICFHPCGQQLWRGLRGRFDVDLSGQKEAWEILIPQARSSRHATEETEARDLAEDIIFDAIEEWSCRKSTEPFYNEPALPRLQRGVTSCRSRRVTWHMILSTMLPWCGGYLLYRMQSYSTKFCCMV